MSMMDGKDWLLVGDLVEAPALMMMSHSPFPHICQVFLIQV